MSTRDFYEGRLAVRVNASLSMTVEDMHEFMNFDLIESSHTFIQWLFPTDAASRFNQSAALLVAEDARSITQNLCTALRVRESFTMMLEFFGFTMHLGDVLVIATLDDARLDHFIRHRHNWMRVSRILRSLVLLGFANYADAFYKALVCEVGSGRLQACRESCFGF